VRVRLAALGAAHDVRVGAQAASALSHALTLGVLALEAGAAAGAPLRPAVDALAARVAQLSATAAACGATGNLRHLGQLQNVLQTCARGYLAV
jgi:hypothetical protein